MRAVTAAGGEEVPREELRTLARAAWVVRGVVRLDEDVVFGGGACECVEVDGIGGVVGVTDDGDVGVGHCAHEGTRIFLLRSGLDDEVVQARDGVVHLLQDACGEIDAALVVHDVQLCAHDDVDAVGGGADDAEVAEVQLVECAGQCGCVVGDAEEGEPLRLCRSCHLTDGAVGVHARQCMRVDVDDVSHGRLRSFILQI